MQYTIGEIARLIGETPHTLRFYAREGLLPFAQRDKAGRRVFSDADLELFHVIQCLKKTGMTLKEIAAFIQLYMQGDKAIGARLAVFLERRELVGKQIAELQATRAYLDYVCWFLGQAEKAGSINIKYELEEKDIPAKFKKMKKKFDSMHLAKKE